MTPEQLKKEPFEEIIKIEHEQLDSEEGESNTCEEESTTSTQSSKESSKYDASTEDEEESQTTKSLQIHNVSSKIMHDEDDSIHDEDESSDEEHVTEIETIQTLGSKPMYKRTNSLLPAL